MKYVDQSRVKPWNELTEAQRQLYLWMLRYLNENHFPPTIREMMKAFALYAPSGIQCRLNALKEFGWIDWVPGSGRTFRLLQHQPIWLPVANDSKDTKELA